MSSPAPSDAPAIGESAPKFDSPKEARWPGADSVRAVDAPQTHYARSGELQIAYQVVGEGPLDLVVSPCLSNMEFW